MDLKDYLWKNIFFNKARIKIIYLNERRWTGTGFDWNRDKWMELVLECWDISGLISGLEFFGVLREKWFGDLEL